MATGRKSRQSETGKKVTLKMAQESQVMIPGDRWSLNLSFKNVATVPKQILKLYGRDEVNLSRNLIRKLPDLSDMPNITVLDLHSNKLEQLPATIGSLVKLEVLNLCDNRLTELTKELGQLKNLHTLYLGMNKLKALPAFIGDLKELRHIGLSDNQITRVPLCLARLSKLERVNLDRNPIPSEKPQRSDSYTSTRVGGRGLVSGRRHKQIEAALSRALTLQTFGSETPPRTYWIKHLAEEHDGQLTRPMSSVRLLSADRMKATASA